MPKDEYIVDERKVGNCTVKVYHDEHPSHPDEGNDDLFLISFSTDFHVVRKPYWDCLGDFSDFMHPKYKLDMPEDEEESGDYEEPAEEPKDNRTDPLWRKAYCEACDNQIEALLHASGEDTDFEDSSGRAAATKDYGRRHDLWYEWQRYKAEHAEWACFTLNVHYHGGGYTRLSLGGIYTGFEEDKWGPESPRGFVMVKKSAGWLQPLEETAESLVKDWQSYCDGDVYGYVVTDDLEEDEEVDSCWGYVGDQDYCMTEGVSAAEWHESNGRKQVLLPFTEPQEGANG